MQIKIEDWQEWERYLHVDVLLAPKRVSSTWNPEHPLIAKLLSVRGVQYVAVDRYKVNVQRSKAIPWDEIQPEIEKVLREYADILAAGEAKP